MTETSKYRNVSLTHETYSTLQQLSKVLVPGAKLANSKTNESVAKEKAEEKKGKRSTMKSK